MSHHKGFEFFQSRVYFGGSVVWGFSFSCVLAFRGEGCFSSSSFSAFVVFVPLVLDGVFSVGGLTVFSLSSVVDFDVVGSVTGVAVILFGFLSVRSVGGVFPLRYQAVDGVASRVGYPVISHVRRWLADRLLGGWRATAHVCLNTNAKGSLVKVSGGETVIDEGEDTNIAYEEKRA